MTHSISNGIVKVVLPIKLIPNPTRAPIPNTDNMLIEILFFHFSSSFPSILINGHIFIAITFPQVLSSLKVVAILSEQLRRMLTSAILYDLCSESESTWTFP